MTDAPLRTIASADGKSWDKPLSIVNGYTDYGLQMTVYRGELYGIMTQTVQYPKQLFATKYKNGTGWKQPWRSLPGKFLSQGRVSITVLDDIVFVLRRGTNDVPYLFSTEDFNEYKDLGRVGSQYAKTMVAPAICAYNGKLFMAGVGSDKYIYFTIADKTGKRQISWTKIPGTGTQSALAMAVYDGKLYLFHTGYNNTTLFWQTYNDNGTWSQLNRYSTNITSGPIATSWKYNALVVGFRGKDEDIKHVSIVGGKVQTKQYVPNILMKYQLGLATWGGKLVFSYAVKSGSKSVGYVDRELGMNEKSTMFDEAEEVGDAEWNCKWDKSNKPQKNLVRKLFCM